MDKMQRNACKVCGGVDMNLVNGFYYCVECGTQDENIQERIVESEAFIGLQTRNAKSKIRNVKEKMNLGPEWCKWHAFNFMIAGLTDELIAAGAKPSVKMKVLWIWTKYMKFFKAKDDRPKSQFFSNDEDNQVASNEKENHDDSCGGNNDDDEDNIPDHNDNNDYDLGSSYNNHEDNNDDHEDNDDHDDHRNKHDMNGYDLESDGEDDKYADRKERMKSLIKNVSKGVIIAIFHLALNLDKSDIQLSHLLRYVKWRYIDISTCTKYIPKDLDVKCIPRFKFFRMSMQKLYKSHTIRYIAMALMRFLNLGLPVVPDMRKIIDNYIKELCLPDDFKELVLSLMYQYPSRHIQVGKGFHYLVVIPDYEAICLSYVVMAFKLCFGLDDDHERNISDVVDKINTENNFNKSYKVGAYSVSSDRLFSFKEWCEYMKLRKMIVCKHNLRMARLYRLDVSDYVFLEHLDKIKTKPSLLTDDIVKDILNKIPLRNEMSVIPKGEFELSFTPMASYTDIILDYIQDPDLRLMLSEDYTQYSLVYAIKKLQLKENVDSRNIFTGVTENNKVINETICGHLSLPTGQDNKMLYIRFCENKDDILKPPVQPSDNEYNSKTNSFENYNNVSAEDNDECQREHTKTKQMANNDDIDKHNDKSKIDDEISIMLDSDQRTITFVDYPNACIYDDDNKDDVKQVIATINESFGTLNDDNDFYDYINSCLPSPGNKTDCALNLSENVDRRTLINELIRYACVTYKISLPPPKKPKDLTKKVKETTTKKKTHCPAEFSNGINMRKTESNLFMMMSSYYKNVQESTSNKDIDETEQNQETFEGPIPNSDLSNNTENESENLNATADCVIQENEDTDEAEPLFDTDDDDDNDDDEFILPETAQLNEDDVLKLDEAADKILEKETNRCGMPPKKRLKLTDNIPDNKSNVAKGDNEKLLHPSAWGVRNFNYWIRHYSIQTQVFKSKDVNDTFNFELFDNLPKSFAFVLQECGSMIDCTPFRLYRQMEYVEKHILLKLKFKKRKRIRKSVKKMGSKTRM